MSVNYLLLSLHLDHPLKPAGPLRFSKIIPLVICLCVADSVVSESAVIVFNFNPKRLLFGEGMIL